MSKRPLKSYFDIVEERNEIVWDVCAYLQQQKDIDAQCRECPAWKVEPGMDEKTKRMCRALAEEIVAKVLSEFTESPTLAFGLTMDDPLTQP